MPNLTNAEYFINREISWLAFNERVLEEALDKRNPLMERLKFLAITASNLDEFFMVRVSTLWEQISAEVGADASGLEPMTQLRVISQIVHKTVEKQYDCLLNSILPALEKEHIRLLDYAALNDAQRVHAETYFNNTLYPVLTPMAIDQSRPFPLLNNRTVNIFAEIYDEDEDEALFSVVQVPTVLPRVLPLSDGCFILLENIILEHIEQLFPGHTVTRASLLRVTRNSDLIIDEEEVEDLLIEMERSIKRRRWGDPVRIEISGDPYELSEAALKVLEKALDLEADEIYKIPGPLDLSLWMGFINGYFSAAPEFARLFNKPLIPKPAAAFVDCESMFDVIRGRDVLVHHPYTSFDCVVRFLQEAAADPQVLAIKQTLYRVSGQSPVVNALMAAAERGKQITVLVELKARFDEENNINWAKKLEQSGCHVVYGLVGLKTHCKVLLVVRREDDGIRRYVHMGTGNYNDATAKIYTDIGFFTCRETFGQDSSTLFNVLTGYSKTINWRKFSVAPLTLRSAFMRLIEQETLNAQNGLPASITARMNSLSDMEIIKTLYRASMAGVKIRLLVRGICCLKTGLPGISENIEVFSIVDRFLEHSRIFSFENAGNPRVYLSSADWMPRNLDQRVEVLFPIEEPGLRDELMEMLELSLSDNVKRRMMQPDGTYKKLVRQGKPAVHSQLVFYKQALQAYNDAQEEVKRDVFRPVYR